MDKIVPFVCPECGHGFLKSGTEPTVYEDLLGIPCANCGNALTDDEVVAQMLKFADAVIRKIDC
jgi:predicted RNA-binding Zn-ribbon protein involved in translation (DUF1610 family)